MLMKQVFKMVTNILDTFIAKFEEKNTLVVSADIENQINQLENEEKKIIWK